MEYAILSFRRRFIVAGRDNFCLLFQESVPLLHSAHPPSAQEMLPIDVDAMMAAARTISPNIALYVPRTCDVAELTALAAVTSHSPEDERDDLDACNGVGSRSKGEEELEQDEVAYFLKNECVPIPLTLHVKKEKNSN